MKLSHLHLEKINSNHKLKKIILENPNELIYIYLNANANYQTISIGILPKIIGTSYNQIVQINPKINTARYITNIELAKAQGYNINYRDINSISILPRIIGNSIPKIFIEYEINSYNISNPSIGVIGGYGLEGILLSNYNFKFLTITNHINNGYLSKENIESILKKNNPPNYIYSPNQYHNEYVDILIWKFPCQYGSNQNRNCNFKKQIKYKENFEDELIDNYKYIQKYSPRYIILELPSNINHKTLGIHNLRKISFLENLLGKDYIREEYAFNTKDYGLNQNRRSYIVRFKLNLPNNIIRGYDMGRNKNFYHNIDTKISSYKLNEL
jgi:site-specific DNA-cytosine methylase